MSPAYDPVAIDNFTLLLLLRGQRSFHNRKCATVVCLWLLTVVLASELKPRSQCCDGGRGFFSAHQRPGLNPESEAVNPVHSACSYIYLGSVPSSHQANRRTNINIMIHFLFWSQSQMSFQTSSVVSRCLFLVLNVTVESVITSGSQLCVCDCMCYICAENIYQKILKTFNFDVYLQGHVTRPRRSF
ncbi:hypothetical protein INR49_006966 [Caranx melampygus]|nr:hypothetical protein INR49_006966 [Caranx melampygus]